MSRVIEKVMPGSMGGGWRRARGPRSRKWAPESETPGMCAVTCRRTAPRQPPTLLRRFGNADQMTQIDRYVRLRLALFVSKKRRRRGISPWQVCRDRAWWSGLGLYELSAPLAVSGRA